MQAALRAVRGPLAVQRIGGDAWIAADKAQGGDMGDDGPPEMMASLELCRQSSHTAHRVMRRRRAEPVYSALEHPSSSPSTARTESTKIGSEPDSSLERMSYD